MSLENGCIKYYIKVRLVKFQKLDKFFLVVANLLLFTKKIVDKLAITIYFVLICNTKKIVDKI
jgi:hypothetical protein